MVDVVAAMQLSAPSARIIGSVGLGFRVELSVQFPSGVLREYVYGAVWFSGALPSFIWFLRFSGLWGGKVEGPGFGVCRTV